MSNIKLRIVKKENDGVTLSSGKGGETVKMTWGEFKKNYFVVDAKWASPSPELMKKINQMNEHISNAAAAFIMSGGLKGNPTDIVQMTIFGDEVQKIQSILGCSMNEVLVLVKKVIDNIRNFGQGNTKPKERHRKTTETKPVETENRTRENGFAVLADNPELLALKEKFENK